MERIKDDVNDSFTKKQRFDLFLKTKEPEIDLSLYKNVF